MHIVVYGVGGIGGFISGRLGQLLEKSGSALDRLSCIARGAHLEAIREKGLTYIDPAGNEVVVKPSLATDNPSEVTDPDLIVVCVKGYDLDDAINAIAPLVKEDTIVLPLLNGADIYDRVRSALKTGIVLPGAIYISSTIVEPGKVQHSGGKGLVITGAEPGRNTSKPEKLLNIFEDAGIPLEWHDDPLPPIWSKFIFISPFGLITAVKDASIGEVLSDSSLKSDVRSMMAEVATVARAKGVKLPENIVDATLEKAAAFPPDTKTSFQRDIKAGKEKDERDLFGGAVIRLGRQAGVETALVEKYLNALPG